MKDLVSEDENRALRQQINELQSQLIKAEAKILDLTSPKRETGMEDDAGYAAREQALESALRSAKAHADLLARLPGENPNPVVRASAEGITIYTNRAAAEQQGWGCVVNERLPAPLLPFLEYSLAHGQAVEEQIALDGRDYWVYIAPFASEGYANVYGRDISSRKRAEQEVLRSHDELQMLNLELQRRNAELDAERVRWQTVVESIADEVWVCDAQGRITLMNARAAATLHMDTFKPMRVAQAAEELDIVDGNGQPRPPEDAPLLRALSGETIRGQEIARERGSGKLHYRQYSAAPTRDADGHITGAVGVVQDITALKEAEKELAESRTRINDILMSLGDGLIALDREWNVIYVNAAASQVAGRPAEEMVGRNLWEMWPALIGTRLEAVYREVMEDSIPRQLRIAGVEHTTRWYDVNVYPSSEGVTVYYSDKTQQVEAEGARAQLLAENQEQRQLLESIFDADPGGIAVFTRHDLRFTFANQAYRSLLPNPEQDPVGQTLEDVWPSSLGFHVLESYLPPGREDEPVTHDRISRRFPDGSMRHFSVHLRPIHWHGERATLVVAWEITQLEQAKAELEEYAAKLQRSNQDLQEFATIASHDMQEPLRKIETFGDMLALRAVGLDERSRDHVERMRDAAKRMRAMVEGLLQLSRVSIQGKPFSEVDLGKLTEEVVSDLGNQVRRTHGSVEIGPLPSIDADPIQMRELMQNLISNGLKYHRPDIEPILKVSGKQLPDRVEITVEDNGIGFEQEYAERIFEPFQRLVGRNEYEGSGMGLAICRRIVERHKGQIHAVSTPGQGSIFTVSLPAGHIERDLKGNIE